MAYDEHLADRTRHCLAAVPGVGEKRMFGGLAFLVHGRMAVAVTGAGGLMVRVPPGEAPALRERAHVSPVEMRGRELAGWLQVAQEGLTADEALAEWVDRGLACVSSLPTDGRAREARARSRRS